MDEPSRRGTTEQRGVVLLSTAAVAGATLIPYLVLAETLTGLVRALLSLLMFVLGVYLFHRGSRRGKTVPRPVLSWAFVFGGVVLIAGSLLGGRAALLSDQDATSEPTPSLANTEPPVDEEPVRRTSFAELWQPTLERRTVTDGGVARVIDGAELEASNCGGSGAKTFQLVNLNGGDRLAFDLHVVGKDDPQGAYQVRLHGAGVDESFNLSGAAPQHVSVETRAAGDVVVDIQALRPTERTCRDSRQFIAVHNGTVD